MRLARERGGNATGDDAGDGLAQLFGNGVEEVQQGARACELPEQDDAEDGEEDVCGPDTHKGRSFAGLGEGDAEVGEQVVDEDEQQRHDKAAALAAPFGGEAERHAYEHQDQTGEGIGKPAVQLDLRNASRVLSCGRGRGDG